MAKPEVTTGYFRNGLPYTRIDGGPRELVIFDGLDFAHKPPSGLMLRMFSSNFKRFSEDFTVYIVSRKPNLPVGYSMRDMSEDYASMIKEEFGGPVDVMGMSTGGPIAQHFAVDHPDLVRHLVLAMTGYRLSENGRQLQRRLADLAQQGKWRATAACLISGVMTRGIRRLLFRSFFWLLGRRIFGSPTSPSDGLVEIEAEDKHDFKEHLAEIRVPTLVLAGRNDFQFPPEHQAALAAGIPNARLEIIERAGHNAPTERPTEVVQAVRDFMAAEAPGHA